MFATFLVLIASILLSDAHAKDVYVPDDLKPWRDWVLHNHPDANCPSDFENSQFKICAWLRKLNVDLAQGENHTEANFTLTVDAFADAEIDLPHADTLWPAHVSVNGQDIPVRGGGQKPYIRVEQGAHEIRGVLSWRNAASVPFLTIPRNVAIVNLTKDGSTSTINQREFGKLWLVKQQDSEAEESFQILVFRLLMDDVPQMLQTRLLLTVSGRGRVLNLGDVLPDQFELTAFSSQIPARFDQDGSLLVQITRGEFQVNLTARASEIVNEFEITNTSPFWPSEEYWAFQPQHSQRIVDVIGVERTDLSFTRSPWSDQPGYLLTRNGSLVLEERQRGDVTPTQGEFVIKRDLMLSFTGDSFIAIDDIQAETNPNTWIASLHELGSVEVNESPQVVSIVEGDDGESYRGLHLKESNSLVQGISEIARQDAIPATGWNLDATQLRATLHIPPGWRLLWANGPDQVLGSWLSSWRIWDVFTVLLLVILVNQFAGWRWSLAAGITSVISFQAAFYPILIGWLFVAGLVLLRQQIKHDQLARVVKFVYWIVLVPVFAGSAYYTATLAKQAIFPQLEPMNRYVSVFERAGLEFAGTPHVGDIIFDSTYQEGVSIKREKLEDSEDARFQKMLVTGARLPREMEREESASPVVIPTGPGTPDWRWKSARFNWTGPVDKMQKLNLTLMPPWLTRIFDALSALLVLGVSGLLFVVKQTPNISLQQMIKSILPLLLVLCWVPQDALAQDFPPRFLLNDLESRLTEPVSCEGGCASIESTTIRTGKNDIEIQLLVHVAEPNMAIPMPQGADTWVITDVVEKDGNSIPLTRTRSNELVGVLDEGVHEINVFGTVLDSARLDIEVPMSRGNIEVHTSSGWKPLGAYATSNGTTQLTIVALADEAASTMTFTPPSIAPYVQVHRHFSFDYEPTVVTRVQRIAPTEGVFNVVVPTIPGETVTDSELPISDGNVTVVFDDSDLTRAWRSSFEFEETIVLTAPALNVRKELWSFDESEFYDVAFEGLDPVKSRNLGTTFMPRSNEELQLTVTKTDQVSGQVVSVEYARLSVNVGSRSRTVDLTLAINASQGGEYPVTIPSDGVLSEVLVGQESISLPSESIVSLPLKKGQQVYVIRWREPGGISAWFRTPSVSLGTDARNINLDVVFPSNRWTLLLGGSTQGAAIKFWGIFVVMLIIAIGISRLPNSIVTTRDAVLLAFGVTIANIWVMLSAGLWFVGIWWRQRSTSSTLPIVVQRFKQIGLILVSVIAIGTLIFMVPTALLGQPDMHIEGYNSGSFFYRWYDDESATELPRAWVFSGSMWSYLIIMLVWSLWLATALVRWVRSTWNAISTPEFWPRKPVIQASGSSA